MVRGNNSVSLPNDSKPFINLAIIITPLIKDLLRRTKIFGMSYIFHATAIFVRKIKTREANTMSQRCT